MPDPIMVPYKWLEILDQEPIEDGGKALNNNFASIADYNGPSVMGQGAPTVDDDITQGFFPWSKWFDTDAGKQYVCLNNTEGAAVWETTDSDVTPGGPDTAVQFNNGGEFGGSEDFTFDDVGVTLLGQFAAGDSIEPLAQIYGFTEVENRHALYGNSVSGYGAYGISLTDVGVYGKSTSGYGMQAQSVSGIALYAYSQDTYSAYFAGDTFTAGVCVTNAGTDYILKTGVFSAYLDGTTGEWVCSGLRSPDGTPLEFGPDVYIPGHLGVGSPPTASRAIYAYTADPATIGVYSTSVESIGVYGQSTNSTGVYGFSVEGVGVKGKSTNNYAGEFEGDVYTDGLIGVGAVPSTGAQVYAFTATAARAGVYGYSVSHYGVRGYSSSSSGVFGLSTSGYGVEAQSTDGIGAFAYSINSYGLYAYSANSYAAYINGDMYLAGGNIDGPAGTDIALNSGSYSAYLDGTTGKWICDGGFGTSDDSTLELGPDVYIPGRLSVGVNNVDSSVVYARSDDAGDNSILYKGQHDGTGKMMQLAQGNGTIVHDIENDGRVGIGGTASSHTITVRQYDAHKGLLLYGAGDQSAEYASLAIGSTGAATLSTTDHCFINAAGIAYWYSQTQMNLQYGQNKPATFFQASGGNPELSIYGNTSEGEKRGRLFMSTTGGFYVRGEAGKNVGFFTGADYAYLQGTDGVFRCDGGFRTNTITLVEVGGVWEIDGDVHFKESIGVGTAPSTASKVYAYTNTASQTGVYGWSSAYHGVYGRSDTGYGVYGYSPDSAGVSGYSLNNAAVYGRGVNSYAGYFFRSSVSTAAVCYVADLAEGSSADTLRLKRTTTDYAGYFIKCLDKDDVYAFTVDGQGNVSAESYSYRVPKLKSQTITPQPTPDGLAGANPEEWTPGVVSFVHPKNTDAGLWFVALMDGSEVDLTQNLKILLTWIYNGATTDTVEFGVQGSIIQNGQAVPAGGISLSGAVTPGNNIVNTTEIDVDLSGAPTTGPFQFSFKVYRNRSGANDTLNADVNSLAYFSQAYFKGE